MEESVYGELTRRAVEGDRVALAVLLSSARSRVLPRVARRIPRNLRRILDPDDVMQEAELEAVRHIRSFQPGGDESFFRWVATIAVRRLRNTIDALRTLKRGGAATGHILPDGSVIMLLGWLAGSERTPSHHAARHEAIAAVRNVVSQLPDHYQEAVRLVYMEGRSVADAAVRMGRTPRAIHNLCRRSKEFLRLHLGSSSCFLSRS